MKPKPKTEKQVLAEYHKLQAEQDAEVKAIYAKYPSTTGTPAFYKAMDKMNAKWTPVHEKYSALLSKFDKEEKPSLSEFAETLLECSAEDDGSNGDLSAAAVSGLEKMCDSKKPKLTKAEAKGILAHVGGWPDSLGADVAAVKKFCKKFA
jgi:hypothetical protein